MYCSSPRSASATLAPEAIKALFKARVVSTAPSRSPVITAIRWAVLATLSRVVGKPWTPSERRWIAFRDSSVLNPICSITAGNPVKVSYRSIAPSRALLTICKAFAPAAARPKAVTMSRIPAAARRPPDTIIPGRLLTLLTPRTAPFSLTSTSIIPRPSATHFTTFLRRHVSLQVLFRPLIKRIRKSERFQLIGQTGDQLFKVPHQKHDRGRHLIQLIIGSFAQNGVKTVAQSVLGGFKGLLLLLAAFSFDAVQLFGHFQGVFPKSQNRLIEIGRAHV